MNESHGSASTARRSNAEGTQESLPLVAGPTIWYALAGLSILLSLYLFLFANVGDEAKRYAVSVFIGLWAPMFGILGLRAEMLEVGRRRDRG